MRIHVVQKGDTLWKIAEKYGVSFEELKKVNTHLTNPDLIMPGMKIKIPSHAVPAKPIDHGKEYVKEKAKAELMPEPMKEVTPAQPIPEPLAVTPPTLEPISVTPPPVDEEMIRRMIRDVVSKELPALVRRMLQEMKQDMVHQIKVDLELNKKTEIVKKYEKKPTAPMKPPAPPQVMPYTPPKAASQGKADIPCPPHPAVAPYQQVPQHSKHHHAQQMPQVAPLTFHHTPQAKHPSEQVSPYMMSPYAGAMPMGHDYMAPYIQQPYSHKTAPYPMPGQPAGVAGMMLTAPQYPGYGVPQTHVPQYTSQKGSHGKGGGGKDCGCKREGEDIPVTGDQVQGD